MKQLLVLLMILCSSCAYAQDVIVKKDGSTIVCRVVELTSSEITYKKWTDLNGANYVMNRDDASAINYQNGKKVNLSEATNLYMPNNQNDGAQQYNDNALLNMDAFNNSNYKKMKKKAWIGGAAFAIPGTALLIVYFASYTKKGFDQSWALYPALGCFAAGAAWTTIYLLKAKNIKNKLQMIESSSIFQHNFNFRNGSSLSTGVDILSDKSIAGRSLGNDFLGSNTLGMGIRYNF